MKSFLDVGLDRPSGQVPAKDAGAPAVTGRSGDLASAVNEVLRIAVTLGMTSPLPPVLTVDQAAEVLNLDRKTLYFAIQRREIPGVRRFGKTLRISTEALMTWMYKGRGGDSSR